MSAAGWLDRIFHCLREAEHGRSLVNFLPDICALDKRFLSVKPSLLVAGVYFCILRLFQEEGAYGFVERSEKLFGYKVEEVLEVAKMRLRSVVWKKEWQGFLRHRFGKGCGPFKLASNRVAYEFWMIRMEEAKRVVVRRGKSHIRG